MECVSAENTSPLTMACKDCGHSEWAEVQISPPWPINESSTGQTRVVVYKKKGQAKTAVIRALRKLDPELGKLSMDGATKRIGSSPSFDLGIHCLNDARALMNKAKEWGFKVVLENSDSTSISQPGK